MKKLDFSIGLLPTALDVWLVLLVALVAFDRPIPWMLWVFGGLELLASIATTVAAKRRGEL